MTRFLDCLVDQRYEILGDAPTVELHKCWVAILSEYYEAKGDTVSAVPEWKLSRDITRLQNHLTTLNCCIGFLNDEYSESIAGSLRRLGYTFKPSGQNPENYRPLLTIIIEQSKKKFIQLQGHIKELDKLMNEKKGDAPERKVFEENLIHIEEMQKVTYDFDTLTVYKYLMLEKKLTNKIELLNQRHGAGANR